MSNPSRSLFGKKRQIKNQEKDKKLYKHLAIHDI